jgi:hypothetical protein
MNAFREHYRRRDRCAVRRRDRSPLPYIRMKISTISRMTTTTNTQAPGMYRGIGGGRTATPVSITLLLPSSYTLPGPQLSTIRLEHRAVYLLEPAPLGSVKPRTGADGPADQSPCLARAVSATTDSSVRLPGRPAQSSSSLSRTPPYDCGTILPLAAYEPKDVPFGALPRMITQCAGQPAHTEERLGNRRP